MVDKLNTAVPDPLYEDESGPQVFAPFRCPLIRFRSDHKQQQYEACHRKGLFIEV